MSCAIGGLSRCAYYYQPKLPDDSVIMLVLSAITDKHLRWGFPKCFNRIRKFGYKWSHRCVYRVYCELKLNLRVKRKQRIPPRSPERLSAPNKQGECWSMDFMSDSSRNQQRFRTFNVIDDFNREALDIDIAVNLPAGRGLPVIWINWPNIMAIHSKYEWIMNRNLLEKHSSTGQNHMV
jgi:putative transposase